MFKFGLYLGRQAVQPVDQARRVLPPQPKIADHFLDAAAEVVPFSAGYLPEFDAIPTTAVDDEINAPQHASLLFRTGIERCHLLILTC
ncbi:MAG TPA: hypothetical protein VGB55_05300 [Tepidisphaeraceae bacterium]